MTGPRGGVAAAPPGLAAREGAVAMVAAVLDRGRMMDEARVAGDGAVRAEAHALADLTLRRLAEVDAALAERVERMPKAPVRHILRVMTAELLYRPGAAHAAVDLAVRQVKGGSGARLSGLVNAVGRKLAKAEAPQVDAVRALPGWLSSTLRRDWGKGRTAAIAAAHRAVPPVDLALRNPAETELWADRLGAEVLPGGGLRLTSRGQISALEGFAEGAWWVQDAAAQIPARLIPDPAGKRVLDLCAAPGGKTLQLAAAGAHVTALDLSEGRMARLVENLSRTRLAAETVVADALVWSPEGAFDAILLDAPCSATGTIRRHPDLPHRFRPGTLEELTALQARLLARAWEWVRPGGVLVYATCSILKAEGEAQAAAFRARSGAMPQPLPATGPFTNAEGDIRTLPSGWPERGGLDGFFAARFGKPG